MFGQHISEVLNESGRDVFSTVSSCRVCIRYSSTKKNQQHTIITYVTIFGNNYRELGLIVAISRAVKGHQTPELFKLS